MPSIDHEADASAFKRAGYEIEAMPGGSTAWSKGIGGQRKILITNSSGAGHRLANSHAYDPHKPDAWLVGIHSGQFRDSPQEDFAEYASAPDAVEAARKLESETSTVGKHGNGSP